MGEEQINQVALSLIPGLGPVTIKQLISYCGSATDVLNTRLSRLRTIPGIGDKTAAAMADPVYLKVAARQIQWAEQQGARILTYTDKKYPARLRALEHAPVVLYFKGNEAALNSKRSLGVVGTRHCTDYGQRAIRRIFRQLKHYSPTIFSGLAYGIDITAHREALNLNLPTVGVLGSSLDKIYPKSHEQTSEQMLEQGGLISELKFGTKAEYYHFPSRNRIIAGLSDALIVVEAREKGGALITAQYIADYGKICLAIPGPIDSPASAGCHRMLKEGKAQMLTTGMEIAELLKWSQTDPITTSVDTNSERLILETLIANPLGVHIDELCRKTQVPINKMGSYILKLELKGQIKPLPGKKFVLVSK